MLETMLVAVPQGAGTGANRAPVCHGIQHVQPTQAMLEQSEARFIVLQPSADRRQQLIFQQGEARHGPVNLANLCGLPNFTNFLDLLVLKKLLNPVDVSFFLPGPMIAKHVVSPPRTG